MGCATSKKKERLCYNCQGPCSPPLSRRSYSVNRRHSPPCSGEFYHHLVSLTSSSLEPLKIESFRKTEHKIAPFDDDVENRVSDEKRVGLIEAKMWSEMIDERIPKIFPRTPIRTPPGEPENINAWELMEGLEDVSPLRPVNHLRSFSFHFGPSELIRDKIVEKEDFFSKPLWLELANRETDSKSLAFDPSVISTFREALDSPNKEISENKGDSDEDIYNGEEIMVLEKEGKCRLFEEEENRVESVFQEEKKVESVFQEEKKVKNKVVLYFTSLRGVRKTYEDCCHARVILKSIGVKLDERDVSMHSGFKEELKELLGDKFSISPLPRVFFGDNYIGGADEIRQMNEEGRLERMLLDGSDMAGDVAAVCEACGDVRFVPCDRCYGSCKIYYDREYESDYDDDDEYEAKEFNENDCGFQRCPYCNENGLVRCPVCCD